MQKPEKKFKHCYDASGMYMGYVPVKSKYPYIIAITIIFGLFLFIKYGSHIEINPKLTAPQEQL